MNTLGKRARGPKGTSESMPSSAPLSKHLHRIRGIHPHPAEWGFQVKNAILLRYTLISRSFKISAMRMNFPFFTCFQ